MNTVQDFDLLTLAEVAKLLHCSKAHVSNAVSGRVPGCIPIPVVALGRRKLVRRNTLMFWIQTNERAANKAAPISFPPANRLNLAKGSASIASCKDAAP